MPQSLERVRADQPIRVNPLNQLVDGYNRNPAAFGNRGFNLSAANGGKVYCINKTGTDLNMGDCAAFRKTNGGILAQMTTYGAFGYLETPTRSKLDDINIAIAAEQIADGGGGYCYISGSCWARMAERPVDEITRAGFDLDEGSSATPYTLKPQTDGPLLILHYSDTAPVAGGGDYWAYVSFAGLSTDWILVKPDTAVEKFDVMGLGAAIYDPGGTADDLAAFKDRPAFNVTTPDEDLHRGKFCVMLQDCASGEYGKAIISGVIQCQINVVDDDHFRADIADGVTASLKSAGIGAAKILWKDGGTGTVWAIVQIGNNINCVTAKAQGDGDGTVSVRLTEADSGTITEIGSAFTVTCPPAGS